MAKLLRGKLKAMLADKRPDLVAPAAVWAKPWVVHINHWGQGHDAVLRYLARYVFRVAITNTRVVARRCPSCGRDQLRYIRRLTPKYALGP